MSCGYAFDLASFRRVGAATRWAEQQMGTMPNDVENSPLSPQEAWVMTPNPLPTGYNGSLAVMGGSYFRTPAGGNQRIADCWIQEINGAPLAAGKMYRGLFGGTLEQIRETGSTALMTLPRFWVESPPQPVVDHFTPETIQVTNYFTVYVPGFTTLHYYGTNKGYIFLGAKLSNIVTGGPGDPVSPKVMVRDSGQKITHPTSGQLVPICSWYHIAQLCRNPIQVAYSAAATYSTAVLDPLGLTSGGMRNALCSYEIVDASASYYTGRSDQLTVVNVAATGGPSVGVVMGA